ncbi:hypothetical protein JHU04_002310 [Brenneria sp. 4F2]|nr:hypothetical protein [Brenneria bubanii]
MANRVILIRRLWQKNNSTISTYEVSGCSTKGYILERPGPDTTVSGLRQRIPEGSYKIKWHNSNIPSVKPYNPVPLLYNANVPQSRYILIHNGNYPRNTDGCLLIGSTKGNDFVGGSVIKLKELKETISQEGIENYTIMITSCYVNCNK